MGSELSDLSGIYGRLWLNYVKILAGDGFGALELAAQQLSNIQATGLLRRYYTHRLVVEPVAGKLDMDQGTPEWIYRLTRGHPFCTQLVCFAVVEQQRRKKKRLVTLGDVDTAAHSLLETGQSHFAYIYDELPADLRLLLTGVAGWSGPGKPILAAEVASRYGSYRLPASAGAIEKSLDQLVDRGILVSDHSGGEKTYQFRVELVRMWVEIHRGLNASSASLGRRSQGGLGSPERRGGSAEKKKERAQAE